MPESYAKCSRCGRAMGEDAKCAVCGRPLCMYDMRVLEGYGMLCPRCYEDLSYEYHSKKCDIAGENYEF